MTIFKTKLFYSYCHADKSYRENMEKSLAVLKKQRIIDEWHDEKLIHGQPFNPKIKEKLEKAHIVIFLVSPDFFASDACMEEWNIAKEQANTTGQQLIPIIIRKCAWKDFDNMKDYLALPTDGKPVDSWDNEDNAWQSVYEGIKNAVENIRKTFTLKPEYKKEISTVEFVSSKKDDVQLGDLFIFPHIYPNSEDDDVIEKSITTFEEITKNKRTIIKGEDLSGKTAFCKEFFFYLVAENKPVIFVDLNEISDKKPQDGIFKKSFMEQFNGDYSIWEKQDNKTIILDNLSGQGRGIEHVSFAGKKFENIFVATSNDYFYSHFKDDKRLTSFTEITINPLKRTHQEQLIKKWMGLSKKGRIEYGKVDQMEKQVDSIIISNKILPRYPFFILSILQRQEAFMPSDLNITLYGHCYHALIVAQLIKHGIGKDDVDACFNFLKELSYFIYREGKNLSISKENYDKFQQDYTNNYLIEKPIIRRLNDGIIIETPEGFRQFFWPYSYYFFLGQYLASNFSDNKELVEKMIEKVYLRDNSLSLIFTIHHARDTDIIEDILIHTLYAFDNRQPAKLDHNETKIFGKLLKDIPQRIISDKSIEEERKTERESRDEHEYDTHDNEEESSYETINQIYKLLKNMEILGQILKNKHGSLKQDKLTEIIEIISDSGLRLINLILLDEKEIDEIVQFITKKWKETNETNEDKRTKLLDKWVRIFIFRGAISTIIKCVNSINKKELGEIVKNISQKKNTPAYDLIYYFYSLDTADRFEDKHKQLLEDIISKNDANDGVLFRILSISTQQYFNTHEVKESLRQSVFDLLNLQIGKKRYPKK